MQLAKLWPPTPDIRGSNPAMSETSMYPAISFEKMQEREGGHSGMAIISKKCPDGPGSNPLVA